MNDAPGCFRIEKGVEMPPVAGRDNRFHRTAARMVVGDSVLFPDKKQAQKLQSALSRIKKHGSIRKDRDKGYRCFCVEHGRRTSNAGRPQGT